MNSAHSTNLPDSQAPGDISPPLRILLVEDSKHDQLAFQRAFKESRIPVEITPMMRAEDALAQLMPDGSIASAPAAFDLVVADYKLPGLSGLDLCKTLLAQEVALPLVLLTGRGSEYLAVEALKAGVDDYLIKDPERGYLDLLPLVLPGVIRRYRDRVARQQAEEALKAYSERLEEMVEERTAELQAQYARLDAILHSVADGVVVTDEAGYVIQANAVARTWLSETLSPENAVRLQAAVRGLVCQIAEVRADSIGLVASGEDSVAPEPKEMLLELQGVDMILKTAPIPKWGTERAAAVVTIQDVSELKAVERMKTRFIVNISHELRTPVTMLRSYVHLMRRRPKRSEVYLDSLEEGVDRLSRLVTDIVQISRIDGGQLKIKPTLTSLNEVIETAVKQQQSLAQAHDLTLSYDPLKPGLAVRVDSEWMVQALVHLLRNAILYTSQGGNVSITTERREVDGHTWAVIIVSDTGLGIPTKELPYVFNRFFRGTAARTLQIPGTGLGLSIVREIVELHGGRVVAESTYEVGSTFQVWLPLRIPKGHDDE
jgi:signal transduction histidine kinase